MEVGNACLRVIFLLFSFNRVHYFPLLIFVMDILGVGTFQYHCSPGHGSLTNQKFKTSNPPVRRIKVSYQLTSVCYYKSSRSHCSTLLLKECCRLFKRHFKMSVISRSQIDGFVFTQETSVDLDSVTHSLKSFVDKVSSYEGAEFPG